MFNKQNLIYGGIAVLGGAAVGATASYFITKSVTRKKYEDSLDQSIKDLKAEYERKLAIAKGEVEDEEAEDETDEASEEEESSDEDDEESDGRSPIKTDYTKYSKVSKVPEAVIELPDIDDIVEPDDAPPEIIERERPYLISDDTFNDDLGEDSRPWYDKKELTLFMKDFIYIGAEKINIPILYDIDNDEIVDVFVDEEVGAKLKEAGLVKCGDYARKNIELDVDDFGHIDYDYGVNEQCKRMDSIETEFKITRDATTSYAEDVLGQEVRKDNYRKVYRELYEDLGKE